LTLTLGEFVEHPGLINKLLMNQGSQNEDQISMVEMAYRLGLFPASAFFL
jgi:hypothetical protein